MKPAIFMGKRTGCRNMRSTALVRTCFIVTVALAADLASLVRGHQFSGDGVTATSLLRLLCHPEQYSGKRICVRGYYASGMEYSGLFLTKESAHSGDVESALWIDKPIVAGKTNHVDRIRTGHA